jgi:hypothetical protein
METPETGEQDQTTSNTNAFVGGIAFVAITVGGVLVVQKVRSVLAARKARQMSTPEITE